MEAGGGEGKGALPGARAPAHLHSMPRVLLEACVESVPHALAAERGGAGRLEVCAALEVGGLTPAASLVSEIVARTRIPAFVMVRSRPGTFVLGPGDVAAMAGRMRELARAGAAGFVLGALTESATVDVEGTRALVGAARGAPVTFHRAFDEVPNPAQALDELIALGVTRVLTAGGSGTALEGADRIGALVRQAGRRIGILAGGGVRAHHAAELVRRTGVSEIHSRTPDDPEEVRRLLRAASGA